MRRLRENALPMSESWQALREGHDQIRRKNVKQPLTRFVRAFYTRFTHDMTHARSRMARFVSPNGVSSAPVTVLTNFYREEFMRHRECLALQREYFSEQ